VVRKAPDTNLLSIVPVVPIPLGKSPFFSYLSEKKTIPIGSVVSISFGSRITRGVVWGDEAKKERVSSRRFRYKPVNKILAASFLSERELHLAEYLSKEARVALGTVLEKFLPKTFESPQKSAVKKIPSLPAPSAKKYQLTPKQKEAARKILDTSMSPLLLFGPAASGKTFVFFELIRNTLKQNGQALILVPDHAILAQEEMRYQKVFGARAIAVFHAKMKDSEKKDIAFGVRNGTVRILLGTGSALFLPFQKLALIIQDDADAPSYCETIGTFHSLPTRMIAETLSTIHAAKLIRASSTPSFSSLFLARKEGRLVEIPPFFDRKISWHPINLRLEKWKKKLAPISEELKFAIAVAIAEKKQVILFVHRSGMSAFSVCAECKKVLRCSACTRILTYQKTGDYRCAGCGAHAGATPSCPTCSSLSFKQIGIGTERVERDLRRKFPNIRVVRYDKNTAKQKKTDTELRNFIAGTADVLITTERGIRGWDLPRLSLIGMIDPDALLGAAGWDTDERAFRTFLSAGGRVGRDPSHPSAVYFQTFHPENPLFGFLTTESLTKFFATLEEERASLLYPPFGRLTRLVCRLASEKKLIEETGRVQTLLETKKESLREKTFVTSSEKSRKTPTKLFEKTILIREPRTAEKSPLFSSVFDEILASLPREWTIEHDSL